MTNEEALKELREWRELAVNRGSYYGKNAIDVYDTAISALESQRWIPVEERLPEHGESVLLYFNRGKTIHAGLVSYPRGKQPIWCIETDIGWDYASYNPTHWMPLPPMPKEEN